jgi:hypothetical protein
MHPGVREEQVKSFGMSSGSRRPVVIPARNLTVSTKNVMTLVSSGVAAGVDFPPEDPLAI